MEGLVTNPPLGETDGKWMRTLGEHCAGRLKDLKRKEYGYDWVNLGDVDRAAGIAITEFLGDDQTYLRDARRRGCRRVPGRIAGWPGERQIGSCGRPISGRIGRG